MLRRQLVRGGRTSAEPRNAPAIPARETVTGTGDRPDTGAAAKRGGTIAHALLDTLRRLGIDCLFGIPGGPISPLYDAALDTDLEILLFQHETMAVHAAAGHALVTGRPGVVLVTSGPGILNALTGVASAHCGEVPLLLLGGDVARGNAARGALQDGGTCALDVERMLAPVTKRCEGLAHPSRAVPLVQEAWSAALSHPRGPVFLRLPFDLSRSPAGPPIVSPAFITAPPEPDPATCRLIAASLAEARRPALYAGLGARQSGAGAALVRLAEAASCPVITDLEGKGVFPESHPLCLGVFGVGARGPAARYLEAGTDLLVTLGARLDDTTTVGFSPVFERSGNLVQLDYAPARLGRAFHPALSMACGLRRALGSVTKALPPIDPERSRERLAAIAALQEQVPCLGTEGSGKAPHDPRRAVIALRRSFGPRTVFTADIGNHMLFAAQTLSVDHAEDFYAAIGLGAMCSGIGTAIGMQLAWGRKRQVVSICGDGGLLMCGNEIATCSRYGIPLVFAVFNDRQLGMVAHGFQTTYGRAPDSRTPPFDVVAYATALGALAARVDDLGALGAIAAWPRDRRPLVLDIPVDPDLRTANPRNATLNFS